MKKTIYKYALREQAMPVLICLAGVCFVLVTGQLLQLMRILFASSCSLKDVAEILFLAMPRLMLYAAPMSVLLGVMLAFVRLNSDSELIAFRAAGVGFLGFLPPVLVVLLISTALAFINAICVIPITNHVFETKLKSMGRNSIPALMKEGVFISTIPKLVFFFRSVDRTDFSIKGVFLQDQRQPNEQVTIVAESAQLVIPHDSNSITFRLANGFVTRAAQNLLDAQAVSFKHYDFVLSMDEIMGAEKGARKRSEMNLAEILDQVRGARDKKALIWWSLEMHQRIAFPSACLLLGLLGPPLGSLFRQRNRMTGVTLGVGIFLVYYIMLSAGRGLGENEVLSPFFAVWTPNLLCFTLALYLWTKMHKETPFYISLLGLPLDRLRTLAARINGAAAQ
jgi:lipopolysaccharide export system permease protein